MGSSKDARERFRRFRHGHGPERHTRAGNEDSRPTSRDSRPQYCRYAQFFPPLPRAPCTPKICRAEAEIVAASFLVATPAQTATEAPDEVEVAPAPVPFELDPEDAPTQPCLEVVPEIEPVAPVVQPPPAAPSKKRGRPKGAVNIPFDESMIPSAEGNFLPSAALPAPRHARSRQNFGVKTCSAGGEAAEEAEGETRRPRGQPTQASTEGEGEAWQSGARSRRPRCKCHGAKILA